MTKSRLTVLIDLDGILIDNIAFEESVTRFIVDRILVLKSVPRHRAVTLWEESLSRERESVKWYDYDHHCSNVGIPALSMEAHQQSVGRLRQVPGARGTWDLLIKYSDEVCVVSEAPRWVMEFKLHALGFNGYTTLLSSQDVGKLKSNPDFWLKLKKGLRTSVMLYIDNKIQNLMSALASMHKLACIYFDRVEHSMALPDTKRPADFGEVSSNLAVRVVRDHFELQGLIMKMVTV